MRLQNNRSDEIDLGILILPMCPPPLLPMRAAFLCNAVAGAGYAAKIYDANIRAYKRYYEERDRVDRLYSETGRCLPMELWHPSRHALWQEEDVLDYFRPEWDDLLTQVLDEKPKILLFYVNFGNVKAVVRFGNLVKKHRSESILAAFGTLCATKESVPCEFLDWDCVCIGPSEESIVEWLHANRGTDSMAVDSVSPLKTPCHFLESYSDNEKAELPGKPKYVGVSLDHYRDRSGHREITLLFGQGCRWGRCRFCGEKTPYRPRNPRTIIEEIEQWRERGCKRFAFSDLALNNDHRLLQEFCELVTNEKTHVEFSRAQMRIHPRNTKELFSQMHRAGFHHIRFGVDSWCDSLRRKTFKGYSMKTVFQNIEDCLEAGLTPHVNLLVGAPGETEEEIDETIDNIVSLGKTIGEIDNISLFQLVSGSEFRRNPDSYGIRFREHGPKNNVNQGHIVPSDDWFSESPYIDYRIRLSRLKRIVKSLFAANVKVPHPFRNIVD